MLFAPILKKTAVFLAKAFVIDLALIVLWIDLVLFETASAMHFFEQQPFVQSAAFTLAVSAAISFAIRSKTPTIFTALCLAYSAFFFVFRHQAALFMAIFCLFAAVNFLYRNKVTEPLLVMLLIITGAWAFIFFIYPSYLVGWANYVAGRKDLGDSTLEGFSAAKHQIAATLAMVPVIVMYLLGKHSYVKLYSVLKSLRKPKTG